MFRLRSIQLAVFSVLAISWYPAHAADVTEVAIKSLPAQTNAVVVVRVEQLIESEIAKSLGWDDRDSGLRVVGNQHLPNWVKTVVRGALLHLGARDRDWTISLITLPETPKFTTLARNEKSYVQHVNDHPIFLSQRNSYFAQVDDETLGIYSPADRQGTARWLARPADEQSSQLSEYLQSALQSKDQLVFAVDLSNCVDLFIAKEWLRSTASVGKSPANIEYYGDLFQSLLGFTFTLNAGQSLSAEVSIDFSEELRPNATQLKEIITEYLLDHGAYLDDLEQAEVVLGPKSLKLRMRNFSESGMRRITSIVLAPTPDGANVSANDGADKAPPSATASRRYFQSIADMIDDLERKNRSTRNYLKTATWHENYAKEIDQLPTGGVDPDLLKFGADTSGRFRALAASLRGVPLEVNTLQNSVTYDVNYDPGWISVGYWSLGYQPANVQVDSNLAQVREKQAAAITAGAKERESVWLMLTQARTDIGQAMSQKYSQAFEKRKK